MYEIGCPVRPTDISKYYMRFGFGTVVGAGETKDGELYYPVYWNGLDSILHMQARKLTEITGDEREPTHHEMVGSQIIKCLKKEDGELYRFFFSKDDGVYLEELRKLNGKEWKIVFNTTVSGSTVDSIEIEKLRAPFMGETSLRVKVPLNIMDKLISEREEEK